MKIIKAITFASEKHKNQIRRGTKLPYVTHPIIVSEFVRKYKGNSKNITDLVCASLLHDVLEDTDTSKEELEQNFGKLVASLVIDLTSDKTEMKKYNSKNEYLIEKMINMSSYALVIKLCDRLSNILDNPTKNYLQDTKIMVKEIENKITLTKTAQKVIKEMKKVLYI